MIRRLTAALLLTGSVAACRCGNDINNVETRFRVGTDTQSIDFGRVLEGTVVVKQVTLVAETRAAVSVGARTQTPFATEPLIDVEGGGQVDLDVSFRASNGESTGELVLTSGRQEVRVPLRGVGVRKPPCTPSASCRMSEYSLELDRCVETTSPDETPCEPDSLCLEQGRCRSGQCLGIARRCNDNDACTSDACAADAGCINSRITCPQPAAPCRIPACDSRTGCGEAVAPDGMACGPSNCTSSKLCAAGMCIEVPTPEGTECGPPIACYGPMRCRDRQCQRPDAGDWLPSWTARIDGEPSLEQPVMVNFNGSIYFTACRRPGLDAGSLDSGTADGGTDGGLPDAGADDAGLDDDGGLDGGERDAGEPDAGLGSDAGLDAGEPACAVFSYTGTGFDRFVVRVESPERLGHVGPAGVVLRTDSELVFRARSTGASLGSSPTGRLRAEQLSMLSDGGVVTALPADGGTHLVVVTSMSQTPLAFLPAPVSHLVTGLDDVTYALSPPDVVWKVASLEDAGLWVWRTDLEDAGTPLLAVSGDSVVAADHLLRWLDDGGVSATRLLGPMDSSLTPRDVLMSPSTIFLFFRGCTVPPMSCMPDDEATWVRAFSRLTGAMLWEDKLLPEGTRSTLIESAALRIPGVVDNPLAAIVEGTVPQLVNGLVISVDGGRALECLFPPTTGRLLAASFTPGQLITLARRGDGGIALEGWPLGALPLDASGWNVSEGVSGQRRPAP